MKKCLILTIITTLVSLSVLPASAHAFGRRGRSSCGGYSSCYTSSCYTPCYNPVVAVPVVALVPVLAYPVLVPAYQFQYVPQTYAPTVPVVPVTGYPVATPIIQPVIAGYGQPPIAYGQPGQPAMPAYGQPGQPAYGQPGQPAQQNFGLNNKDKIRELAKALLEEMNKMAENAPVDSGPPTVPGTQSQQPPLGQSPPQQPPLGQSPPQQPDNGLAQVALNAMQRTCAQCHTGVGSKGSTIIFTQPGYINKQVNWKKIKDEIVSSRMPPKDVSFQFSPQEKGTIIQWLTSIGVN